LDVVDEDGNGQLSFGLKIAMQRQCSALAMQLVLLVVHGWHGSFISHARYTANV